MVRSDVSSFAETLDVNPSLNRRRCTLGLATLMISPVGYAAANRELVPPVQLWQVARQIPGTSQRWQRIDPVQSGVRLWRAGRELAARRLMELLPGDEIETAANTIATVRFRFTGDTLVLERTRVRIGSLEVFFGRVFALLRNRFTVSSQTVVAGVEGTRFLFEVGRDRTVRVAVADGVIVCRSPRGGWAPVRLHANQTLLSRYPSRTAPLVSDADTRELRGYEELSLELGRTS